MNRQQAIKAIEAVGYDISQSSTEHTIYVAVIDAGDDDPEAVAALVELRAALPALDVDWTGNGDTWGDGSSTSDIGVSGFAVEADDAPDSERTMRADYDLDQADEARLQGWDHE